MTATIVTKTASTGDATPSTFNMALLDLLGDSSKLAFLHALVDSSGALIDPAKTGDITTLQTGIVDAVNSLKNVAVTALPFAPIPKSTVSVTAGPTATTAGAVKLAAANVIPAGSATSYRVRNSSSSASPVTFILTTDQTKIPVIPTPYAADGSAGSLGDKTIDPGSVEVISLTTAQQTALAAGTLYIGVITPTGGSGVLSITPGIGG